MTLVSPCCGKDVTTKLATVLPGWGLTNYYICTKCGKPTDPVESSGRGPAWRGKASRGEAGQGEGCTEKKEEA